MSLPVFEYQKILHVNMNITASKHIITDAISTVFRQALLSLTSEVNLRKKQKYSYLRRRAVFSLSAE